VSPADSETLLLSTKPDGFTPDPCRIATEGGLSKSCALTEFSFTPKRQVLPILNALPHLDVPEHTALISSTSQRP